MSNNALAVYQKIADPVAAVKLMAKSVASMIPGTSIDQGEGIAWVCLIEGIHPLDFNRRYHWMPGKGATMRADAMQGEFEMNFGGRFEVIESTHEVASANVTPKDGKLQQLTLSRRNCFLSRWPWAKAEKNGAMGWQKANQEVYRMIADGKSDDEIFIAMQPHFKDNWGTEFDWKNMLWARLVSSAIRIVCSQVNAGIYTPEEMEDVDENIIDAVSFTATKARATAAEVMESVANPIPTGQPAEVVVDVTPSSVKVADVAPFEDLPQDVGVDGSATRAQLERLLQLRSQMNLSDIDWNAALANRNVKAAHSLTKEQAAELIDKMEARIKAAAAKN